MLVPLIFVDLDFTALELMDVCAQSVVQRLGSLVHDVVILDGWVFFAKKSKGMLDFKVLWIFPDVLPERRPSFRPTAPRRELLAAATPGGGGRKGLL